MRLLLLGTSHRHATVDVRGRLAAAAGGAGAGLLRPPSGRRSISELLVLATCHRVEFYAVADDAEAGEDAIRAYVAAEAGEDLLAPGEASYRLVGEAAIRHLCRVACGLDSMIVGESEIAGQIRRALATARASGAAGVLLDRVVASALRASGRARAETRIGVGAFSAATAAVSVVEDTFGTLTHRSVVVVGAGQAGRQALHRLAKRRTGRLTILSRSSRHAEEAARETDARVASLDAMPDVLAYADAVVAATVAPGYLVNEATFAQAPPRRRLLVDLSVPRIIDPAVAAMPGVSLRTVDDLGDIVRASAARRTGEIPRVEAIVIDEARRAALQFEARAARMRGEPPSAAAASNGVLRRATGVLDRPRTEFPR